MGLLGEYSGFGKVNGQVQGVVPGCPRAEGDHVPGTERATEGVLGDGVRVRGWMAGNRSVGPRRSSCWLWSLRRTGGNAAELSSFPSYRCYERPQT